MQYEIPIMEVRVYETYDIITLSSEDTIKENTGGGNGWIPNPN